MSTQFNRYEDNLFNQINAYNKEMRRGNISFAEMVYMELSLSSLLRYKLCLWKESYIEKDGIYYVCYNTNTIAIYLQGSRKIPLLIK